MVTYAVLVGVTASTRAEAAGPYTSANGNGSTYAANAFAQWIQDVTSQGLPVNYTPSSSPIGLTEYSNGVIDFAGSEAEYNSLLQGTPARGYQYTPDVAGATAIMYNMVDPAGRPVNYLHLTQLTAARIFMGLITNWDDPRITADNRGLAFPPTSISVVFRSGASGTTALFYDFVQHADPVEFATWNAKTQVGIRPLSIDNAAGGGGLGLLPQPATGSDLETTDVQRTVGSIAYDEFSYPKSYGVPVAWVQNAAGKFTQPYALNISAALSTAKLSPIDNSQDLSGVYTSTNPLSYPISAYSYIVTQCNSQPPPFGPTCVKPYPDQGLTNTLSAYLSYIACSGQQKMAEIGYAPLPATLSQLLGNAVGYMTGQAPVTLTAANCPNPQEQGGTLGVGASGPTDPFLSLPPTGSAASGSGGSATPSGQAGSAPAGAAVKPSAGTTGPAKGVGTSTAAGGAAVASGGVPGAVSGGSITQGSAAAGSLGQGKLGAKLTSPGGGTTQVRRASPVDYKRPIPGGVPVVPLIIFIALLVVPPVLFGVRRRGR